MVDYGEAISVFTLTFLANVLKLGVSEIPFWFSVIAILCDKKEGVLSFRVLSENLVSNFCNHQRVLMSKDVSSLSFIIQFYFLNFWCVSSFRSPAVEPKDGCIIL